MTSASLFPALLLPHRICCGYIGHFAIYTTLNSATERLNVENNGAVLTNTDIHQTRLPAKTPSQASRSRTASAEEHIGNRAFGPP